jgi:hypothetical protein
MHDYVRRGDLVSYKSYYGIRKKKGDYKVGLVVSIRKAALGMQLTIIWNRGAITETSYHLLCKVRRNHES